MSSKVQEICKLIPAFSREIDWHRGQSKEGKDTVRYRFKNGSELDNLAARESTRGQRRHGRRWIAVYKLRNKARRLNAFAQANLNRRLRVKAWSGAEHRY